MKFFRRSALLHRLRPTLMWLVLLAATLLAATLSYRWTQGLAYERLDDSASRQLDLYASVLENELARYDYLPRLLQIDSEIGALLEAPELADRLARANRKLTRFAVMSGVASTFVLDARGTVLAASDWYQAGTLVGRQLPVADYLGGLSRPERSNSPFPPGAVPARSDHCFAQPLLRAEQVLGAAVVCVSLDPLEATWTGLAFPVESEKPFVADADGLVILSSVAAWKSHRLAPAPTDAGDPRGPVFLPGPPGLPGADDGPVDMRFDRSLAHGAQLVQLKSSHAGRARMGVLSQLPIPRYGWRLFIVSDASEVGRSARNTAWAAGALTAFAGLLLLYLLQRRRVNAQKLAARAQLEQAYEALEREVQLRTAELLQAGKMALLGQLSTGISHELGQPLTALRALAGNTRLLLERGRVAEVRANLDAIADMVERMGRITSQLKSFARKTSGDSTEVPLNAAIDAARRLMHSRIRDERIAVTVATPARLLVRCNANRLEQVLVNLMANAIDALQHGERKALDIRAREAGDRVVITVADSGPGIPEATRKHLFEPFFTTKPAGEGLGLGLVISASIVQEFGGTLRAVATVEGAAFEFDLASARPPETQPQG